jgi:hypothetical protein
MVDRLQKSLDAAAIKTLSGQRDRIDPAVRGLGVYRICKLYFTTRTCGLGAQNIKYVRC